MPRTWGTSHRLALRQKGLTGLYVGTGAPWAGQDREKGRADAIDGVKVLVRAGNFGADPPTGSKGGLRENWPVGWDRRPLGGTNKSQWSCCKPLHVEGG